MKYLAARGATAFVGTIVARMRSASGGAKRRSFFSHQSAWESLAMRMASALDIRLPATLLHEVVEDRQPPQRGGFGELRREGFAESVLAALDWVTRREGETCEDVIRRSLTHPVVRRVKLADLKDNLDIRRLERMPGSYAENSGQRRAPCQKWRMFTMPAVFSQV